MRVAQGRRMLWLGLLVVVALTAAACGSSSSSKSSSSGGGSSSASAASTTSAASTAAASSSSSGGVPASVAATVKKYETMPQTIPQTALGLKPFKPKAGGSIYSISCDLAIVGCNEVSGEVGIGAKAIGYKWTRCNGGTSASAANACFTDAINAKPSAIVVNAIGNSGAAAGYAAAKKAGIPIVGLFTGDSATSPYADVQVGATGCYDEGLLIAQAIAVDSGGKGNILFATETSIGCDVQRTAAFKTELPKACPGCKVTYVQFNTATISTSLPQQIQASLNSDPSINYIVGVFDGAAAIAVQQVEQAGKSSQIKVVGMDADPANVEYLLKKQVQVFDAAFGFGSGPWGAVDAAARLYAGQKVPKNDPASIYLLTQQNASTTGPSKIWQGPPNYQQQFKTLWDGQ